MLWARTRAVQTFGARAKAGAGRWQGRARRFQRRRWPRPLWCARPRWAECGRAGAYTRLFGGRERVFGIAATVVLGAIAVAAFGPAPLVYAAGLTGLGFAISETRVAQGRRGEA